MKIPGNTGYSCDCPDERFRYEIVGVKSNLILNGARYDLFCETTITGKNSLEREVYAATGIVQIEIRSHRFLKHFLN
jgi:hypothetical protein